jgi:hypothetical protein
MLLKLYTEPFHYFPAIPAGKKFVVIVKADSSLTKVQDFYIYTPQGITISSHRLSSRDSDE